ncbi:MAG: hypothetical protein IJ623_08865 [Bacteroidales bacterium]|nr:hypothetical protein [Bacteroidales bacterium]
MDNTKVSVDADGKTQWEVGDQIVFSGRPTAKVVHTLTAEELTNPRLAKITVDLSPLTTEDESTPHKWNVAYPAEIWSPYSSSHMYGRSRFEGTNRLLLAGYVSDDMTSIVMNHVTASILFKVSGDFDSYIFFGNGGTEVLGYEKYLVEINSSSPSYLAKLGAATYGTLDPVTKLTGSVIADGSTVNAIYIQNEADLSSGFTIQFLESGVIKKVISTNTPLTLTHGHAVNLGALPAAALKDYVAPTTHDNEIGVTVASATDLSASASANSYIVSAAGDYKFKAVKGNSSIALSGINKVDILWETVNTTTAPEVNSVIAAADYDLQDGEDAVIVFKTPATLKPGNALIAAKGAAGKILWSWHIWIPETVISTNTYGDIMGAVAMDRNLGALVAATAGTSPVDVTSFGLLYQWGRKDPFPGAASLASSPSSAALAGGSITKAAGVITLEESIANPTLMGYTANGDWIDVSDDNLWKNAERTIYDPCPAGYRVPARDNSKDFWSSDLSAKTGWAEDGTNGWFTLGNPVAVFPFAGYIDDDGLSYKYAGSRAMYWTSHRSGSVTSYGADIRAGSRHQLSSPARSRAGSVRCVAE